MSEVTTATGKTFQSDYMVTIQNPPLLYIRIIGEDQETIERVFKDPAETTIISSAKRTCEGYTDFCGVTDEGNALKVRLKKHGQV